MGGGLEGSMESLVEFVDERKENVSEIREDLESVKK